MKTDNPVVTLATNRFNHREQVLVFARFLIPNKDFIDMWMIVKKRFISLTDQHVNLTFGMFGFNPLRQSCRENHITDECGLYDENFFLMP